MVYGHHLSCLNAPQVWKKRPLSTGVGRIFTRGKAYSLVSSLFRSFILDLLPNNASFLTLYYLFIYAYCIANMSGEAMYPLDSSSYTYWDGKKYEVKCTIPGAAVGVDLSYDCPDEFVSPRNEGDLRNCIQVISPQLSPPLSCK